MLMTALVIENIINGYYLKVILLYNLI